MKNKINSNLKFNENFEFIKKNSNRIIVFCGPSGTGKTFIMNYLNKKYGFKKVPFVTTRTLRKNENQEGSVHLTPLDFKILEIECKLFISARNYGNAYAYFVKDVVESLCNKNLILMIEAPSSYIISDVIVLLPKSVIFGFFPVDNNFTKDNLKSRNTEDSTKQIIRALSSEIEKEHLCYSCGITRIYPILPTQGIPMYTVNQVEKVLLEKNLINKKLS